MHQPLHQLGKGCQNGVQAQNSQQIKAENGKDIPDVFFVG